MPQGSLFVLAANRRALRGCSHRPGGCCYFGDLRTASWRADGQLVIEGCVCWALDWGAFSWLDRIPNEIEEVRLEVTVPDSHVAPQVLSLQTEPESQAANELAGTLPILRPAEDIRVPLTPAGSIHGLVIASLVDEFESAQIVALWEPVNHLRGWSRSDRWGPNPRFR